MKLEQLHPQLRVLCEDFLAECHDRDIPVAIMQTWRDPAKQAELYAQGRTTPGPIVTNAKPGQSLHEHTEDGKPAALAFDFCPIECLAQSDWMPESPLWEECGEIGESLGLIWGGRWTHLTDRPHLELHLV